MTDPTVRALTDPVAATEPRRTAVWIIRDEVPVWGGILWTRTYNSDNGAFDLTASTFESYLARRRIRSNLIYAGQDQQIIMANLVEQAQAVAFGNIGIQVPYPGLSGVLRDRSYFWHERATFLARMQELAQVIGGPDFTISPGWSDGFAPIPYLEVGTPLGTTEPDPHDYYELPTDVRNYAWPEDGGNSANYWSAIGDPTGPNPTDPPLIRDASVPAEWDHGYPLLEDVSNHQGVSDPATLQGWAIAEVTAAAGNRVVPTMTMRNPNLPALGDTGNFRVTDERRWPPPVAGGPGLTFTARITGWTVNLSEGEGETVELDLGAFS
jgi:hypothetical protein